MPKWKLLASTWPSATLLNKHQYVSNLMINFTKALSVLSNVFQLRLICNRMVNVKNYASGKYLYVCIVLHNYSRKAYVHSFKCVLIFLH